MKKSLLAAFSAIMLVSSAWASETINVKVKGMVCPFCAQGLEKKFKENSGVDTIEVNLDKKLVQIKMKEDKTLSDDEINKLVKDAGYNVHDIKRDK